MSIHNRPDRANNPWIVRWRDHEQRQRSRAFPTKRAAAEFDREMQNALRQAADRALLEQAAANLPARVRRDIRRLVDEANS